ncbi:Protein slit [Talaromyces islandicus]|uniref:Protein slit n=1 Tax=Talaromyces islandicus TaxID=28573 RepID=A0A0U1M3H3_TALIS|nr:Protein slit [Talaromyces islandicus]
MTLSNEDILTECPNPNALVCSATWYRPPSCVNFTICSRCFEDHVRRTPFASRFQAARLDPKPDRACLFNTERMRLLWSSAISNGNGGWDALHGYMRHRDKVPNCQRKEGVKAGDPGSDKLYKFRNAEIPEFACCVACYEDTVCVSPFADRFVLSPSGLENSRGHVVMICDLSVKFIYRALIEQSPRQDWTTFTNWAAMRLRLPACESLKSLKCSSTSWYMPNPPLYGVVVCGACFHDGADLTPMAGSFLEVAIPQEKADETWECANSASVLPMAVAWSTACNRINFGLWYNAARAIVNYPPCTENGIQNGVWYSMSGCPDFRICGRCFVGIIQSQGDVLGRHFHQSTNNSTYVCDFFINKTKRVFRYFEKLDEAITLGNGQIFHDFIARVSPQPVCPTDGTSRNRRWYCSNDEDGGATICESCYEEAIRGTSFAGRLTLRERADECFCDGYSPRMRGIWAQACASNDMRVFSRALKERTQVYLMTVPRMRTILEMAKMRMNTQSTLMLSSVMLQGADNIVSASRPVGMSHDLYGNSQIGYHWETAAGAQGEMQFRQAASMGIAQTGDMVEMAQLGALWKQYE